MCNSRVKASSLSPQRSQWTTMQCRNKTYCVVSNNSLPPSCLTSRSELLKLVAICNTFTPVLSPARWLNLFGTIEIGPSSETKDVKCNSYRLCQGNNSIQPCGFALNKTIKHKLLYNNCLCIFCNTHYYFYRTI